MKIKNKKTIISIMILSLIPFFSHAIDWDYWTDTWKSWTFQTKNTSDEKTNQKTEDDEPEEHIDLDKEEIAKDDPKVDFYDTLGIKLFPLKHLIGSDETLQKHLNTLFKNKREKGAVSYFISLERKNHDLAISILESLAPDNRLTLLLQCPPAFIAKILVDMRTVDFKGKTLSHWGIYNLQSEYFGSKIVDHAEIKGESVTLQYIVFLLFHNIKTKEEAGHRASALAKILSCIDSENLPSMLIYTNKEASAKLGQKHKSCFGAVKSKGYCDEVTVILLPVDFISNLLNFMHKNNMISNKDLVNVLEKEFEINQERFQAILNKIDKTIMQEVIFNFSEDVHSFLPDDIILSAIPSFEEDNVLKITADKDQNSSQQIIISEDNDDLSKKNDL